jgi:bacterioferritin-associated ferredoxin
MGHVDNEGEYIIDSVPELREFIGISQCPECVNAAKDVLAVIQDKPVTRMVFSMKCEHLQGKLY